ncbi:uncharacterized protein VTP21DRAFT_7994 [Calcarisporiella thermophila]|uniref:uncharacterized protein n=1 Tax=Calcarisporiella thermophila TaxID=911321 RepID=UPI0037448430
MVYYPEHGCCPMPPRHCIDLGIISSASHPSTAACIGPPGYGIVRQEEEAIAVQAFNKCLHNRVTARAMLLAYLFGQSFSCIKWAYDLQFGQDFSPRLAPLQAEKLRIEGHFGSPVSTVDTNAVAQCRMSMVGLFIFLYSLEFFAFDCACSKTVRNENDCPSFMHQDGPPSPD